MSSREDLIGGAERYLRRKLTDNEIQQLMHASDSFKLGNNDALWIVISMLESNKWSMGETLESYRSEFEAIPAQIKEAANAERKSLEAAGQLAASQAQVQIVQTVKLLVPAVENEVAKAAGNSIRRIQLGEGMISIGAGGLITGAVLLVGILLGAGILHNFIAHPKRSDLYWKELNWAIGVAIAAPIMTGLGIYALIADYSSETKFGGWVLITFSVVAFLIPGLKVMGWWWK